MYAATLSHLNPSTPKEENLPRALHTNYTYTNNTFYIYTTHLDNAQVEAALCAHAVRIDATAVPLHVHPAVAWRTLHRPRT